MSRSVLRKAVRNTWSTAAAKLWRRRGGVPKARLLLGRGHLAERLRHPLIAGVLERIETTNHEAARDLVPNAGYLLKA